MVTKETIKEIHFIGKGFPIYIIIDGEENENFLIGHTIKPIVKRESRDRYKPTGLYKRIKKILVYKHAIAYIVNKDTVKVKNGRST